MAMTTYSETSCTQPQVTKILTVDGHIMLPILSTFDLIKKGVDYILVRSVSLYTAKRLSSFNMLITLSDFREPSKKSCFVTTLCPQSVSGHC